MKQVNHYGIWMPSAVARWAVLLEELGLGWVYEAAHPYRLDVPQAGLALLYWARGVRIPKVSDAREVGHPIALVDMLHRSGHELCGVGPDSDEVLTLDLSVTAAAFEKARQVAVRAFR
jgi:hypothetical protein